MTVPNRWPTRDALLTTVVMIHDGEVSIPLAKQEVQVIEALYAPAKEELEALRPLVLAARAWEKEYRASCEGRPDNKGRCAAALARLVSALPDYLKPGLGDEVWRTPL